MQYCLYYQAQVNRSRTWFVASIIRSFEHVCFDRTLDPERDLFEFFVPPLMEPYFLAIMKSLQERGCVSNVVALPNRMAQELK